ncbi:MAG: alpha/beta hydrolase [Bacteroidetes bacterium HGW-Bacteroidetes-4]|jgi:pimeloyl-ACP methyl ester carboxylesterase|nr:MAG: alpha/beta hydrolase [Bacteroidetes bacterium HGW-Bacteroidetes-4]
MAKLSFKKFGAGEPLIILHGLYGSSDNWVSVARELMDFFSVYVLDLRNHGDSPHLPEHNYQVMTDDLVEFMNEQQIYSANILGHSMGGKVAMMFTALNPERVKNLVVVDISPRSYSSDSGDSQIADHQTIMNALFSVDLQKLKSRSEADSLLAKQINSKRIRQFLLKNLHRNKDKSFSWKINLDVLYQSLPQVLIGLEDEASGLEDFRYATLFIKGGQSDYIRDKDETLIRQMFRNVKIETIPSASHWVHAEEPDVFLALVKNFLL